MATSSSPSSRKRPLPEDVKIGYIHNTSPIKRSAKNSDYFNATMQTGTKTYQRVVCFSGKKLHDQFTKAEEKRTPVKINQTTTATSWTDPSKLDIKVFSKSSVEDCQVLPQFKCRIPEPDEENIITSVTDFVNDVTSSEKRKLNITGHITQIIEEKTPHTLSYGKNINRKKFALADEISTVNFTAWGSTIELIKINKTYAFTALSVSNFDNVKQLQTTPATTLEEVETMKSPCTDDPHKATYSELHDAQCQTVECTSTKNCANCKETVPSELLGNPTFKCNSCKGRQKTSSVMTFLKLKLNVTCEGITHRLTAYNPLVEKFLDDQYANYEDSDQIEEFFLDLKSLNITFNAQLVITEFSADV